MCGIHLKTMALQKNKRGHKRVCVGVYVRVCVGVSLLTFSMCASRYATLNSKGRRSIDIESEAPAIGHPAPAARRRSMGEAPTAQLLV